LKTYKKIRILGNSHGPWICWAVWSSNVSSVS
jgi:hypothetical protein